MTETVLKEGFIKHRQKPKKWKSRYAVLRKVSPVTDRLRMVLYKDQMNSIAHEGKEKAVVQLDEFCGLEAGLKVDSERHVVAIVTSNETHCLAFRNEVEMRQWADVLRDHLGLEWVFQVNVAQKHKLLKQGMAQLRFCVNFVSITAGNPPVCQGIWQLSHLRKYGGSEMSFSFEAGSQAMGGEGVYCVETKYGNQIKELLDCVAQHKPLPRPESLHSRTSADRSSTVRDFYVNVPAFAGKKDADSRTPVPLSAVSSPVRVDATYTNMPSPGASSYQNVVMDVDPGSQGTRPSMREASPSLAYENTDMVRVYRHVDQVPGAMSYVNVGNKRGSRTSSRHSASSSTLPATLSPGAEAQLNYIPVQPVVGSPKGRQRFPLQAKKSTTIEYTEVDIAKTQALNASVKQHDLLREQSLSQIKS